MLLFLWFIELLIEMLSQFYNQYFELESTVAIPKKIGTFPGNQNYLNANKNILIALKYDI